MTRYYTIVCILFSGILNAQTIFLPSDSTITWTGVTTGFYGGPGNISYYWNQFSVDSTNNDTLINTLGYTKLNLHHNDSQSEYYACFRSDTLNQSIYFVPKDSINEYLFFDYSLDYEIGDSVFIPHYYNFYELGGSYFQLLEIDSNLIDNDYYEIYSFIAINIVDSLTNMFSWYESDNESIVISERMITGTSFPFFSDGHFSTFFELSCYQENGTFEWNNGETCPLLDFASVNKREQLKINIYPNPSKGIFTVNLEQLEVSHITIYSLNGKVVYTKTTNSNTIELNLSHLTRGIYILELEAPSQLIQEKIIIE